MSWPLHSFISSSVRLSASLPVRSSLRATGAAGASGGRLLGRLHAVAGAVAQAPRMPVGRARAVGRAPHTRRERER
eukprot:197015-Pleurochrysis_carterae.AAC.1